VKITRQANNLTSDQSPVRPEYSEKREMEGDRGELAEEAIVPVVPELSNPNGTVLVKVTGSIAREDTELNIPNALRVVEPPPDRPLPLPDLLRRCLPLLCFLSDISFLETSPTIVRV
jgi:hypothetical protein